MGIVREDYEYFIDYFMDRYLVKIIFFFKN